VRIIITALIVAAIAIGVGYFAWDHIQAQNAAERAGLRDQITQLESERAQLQAEDDRTKAQFAKVQAEEERLAAANEEFAKALEKARLTGKIPPPSTLPYPPK